ncbi:MAG: hypothetical protein JW818_22250, partial [Pirellulales bacterium]|nr:hypothetical protein [Pirellulales bacterium]
TRKYRTFNFYNFGTDHLRQRRFLPVHPGIKFDPHAGYGFTMDRGLKWTSRGEISKDTLNGSRGQSDPGSIPLDMLVNDFVHADREFRFRIDLPQDEYRFTFVFADRSPEPRDHGPLHLRTEQRSSVTNQIKNIRVPAGKTVVRHYDRQIQQSWYPFMIFGFQPASEGADAILSALTVHRHAPALAHAPKRRISPKEPCTLSATITLPPQLVGKEGQRSAAAGDRLAEATLHYRTDGNGPFQKMPLATDDGLIYRATLDPDRLDGKWLDYYFSAIDRSGHAARLPEQADAAVFRSRLSADTNPPEIVHTPITRWPAGRPLPIEAQIRDPDGVAVVRVCYRRMDQTVQYDSILMERKGDKYVATIPGSAIPADWDFVYYIEAVDQAGTGTSFPDWTKTAPCVFVVTEAP